MGKVLKHNVFLTNPETPFESATAFLKGDELPDWAEGLVGDHVFEEAPKAEPAPRKGKVPTPKKAEEANVTLEVPDAQAGIATWKKFAKAYAGLSFPQSITREEIFAAIKEAKPEFEVPTSDEDSDEE